MPGTSLSNKGDKFNYDLFHEESEQSPWSNGIVERQNAGLTRMITNSLPDDSINYLLDVILAWVVSAKNILHTSNRCKQIQISQIWQKKSLTNLTQTMDDAKYNRLISTHLNALDKIKMSLARSDIKAKD